MGSFIIITHLGIELHSLSLDVRTIRHPYWARAHLADSTRRRGASLGFRLAHLVALASLALASIGDRAPAYERCVSACVADGCTRSEYRPSPLWSCAATCSYACQQSLTDLALSLPPAPADDDNDNDNDNDTSLEGLPRGRQVQFHGKWPFHRLDWSGLAFPFRLVDYFVPRVQEPLSVLFSLANLYAHYRGYRVLESLARSSRTAEGRNLAKVYLAYSVTGLYAWCASVVFHTRDTPWTERLDYFGAGLTTLVSLWACIIRVAQWHHTHASPTTRSSRRKRGFLTASFAVLYLTHVAYLALACLDRFDYAYNLRVNISVSVLTIALWLYWAFSQSTLPTPSNFSRRQLSSYPSARTRFRAPHHLDPIAPVVALPVLALLEVFDFAPVGFGTGKRLLDAHALWHLSTVFVVDRWYKFLTRDVRWIDGQGDPPTAANSTQPSSSRSKDTPAQGRGGGGGGGGRGFEGIESRRGNLKDGMVGFGLGVLDKYGLGLGGGKPRTGTGGTGSVVSAGGGGKQKQSDGGTRDHSSGPEKQHFGL